MRELEPLWNEAQKLRDTEIVELEESIQKYRQQRDKVTNKLEIATVEVTEHEEDKKRLETLCKRAEDVARQQREAKQLELEIDRLESELARTGSTRTVTDCQRELEDLAEERYRHNVETKISARRKISHYRVNFFIAKRSEKILNGCMMTGTLLSKKLKMPRTLFEMLAKRLRICNIK